MESEDCIMNMLNSLKELHLCVDEMDLKPIIEGEKSDRYFFYLVS